MSDVVVMERSDSWHRLASTNVGRLAVTVQALPIVVPVKYLVVDEESLVFAIEAGTALSGAIDGSVFAFEAGAFDAETDRWWSVMAHGRANLLRAPHPSATMLDHLQMHPGVCPALGVAQLLARR